MLSFNVRGLARQKQYRCKIQPYVLRVILFGRAKAVVSKKQGLFCL